MKYCYDEKKYNGYEPCDILVQHYNSEDFRTIHLRQHEFEHLKPWELCMMLNKAHEQGEKDAMARLRRLIGAAPE